MATLDICFAQGHGDDPVTITTPDEVDALIAKLGTESPVNAPILLEVHLSGDPYTQGMDVGLKSDRGVLRYSGRDWPEGVYSTGDGPTDGPPLAYFYMDNHTEFPSNSEIPLTAVQHAIREFLTTNGARPTGITCQPEP